jgi:hypothetical protein
MWRTRPLVTVFVDQANTGREDGSQTFPYDTVTEGVDAAGHGTTISIEAADYDEGPLDFDKRGTVRATGGTATVR